jgi:hypothetical protein
MGCDIHTYIEKKKNGVWVPAQGFMLTGNYEPDIPDVPVHDTYYKRDYCLFGFLAGVRYPQFKRFEPKGFPEDASEEVKRIFDYWGSDAHTPSYLTQEELKSVDWDTEEINCYGEGNQPLWKAFERFYDLVFWLNSYDYNCEPDELRIVFWFDN